MLFSTNYFGSIPYFQALAQFDGGRITIDLYERYKKQTWRNRTQILNSNGPLHLSVPVMRPDGGTSIVKDITISSIENWQKDHWKALESSYHLAPYFFYYGEQMKELFYMEEELLVQFNYKILKKILFWLDLSIDIDFNYEYISPKDKTDFRVALDERHFTKEQERYIQVFSDKFNFTPNLSIIDLLMNLGPMAHVYLKKNRF